jgi:hypothetical protein
LAFFFFWLSFFNFFTVPLLQQTSLVGSISFNRSTSACFFFLASFL